MPYDADNWTEVDSSHVAAVGTRGPDLLVQFHGGNTYLYRDMAQEYEHMINSESVGRYLAKEIKPIANYKRLPRSEE